MKEAAWFNLMSAPKKLKLPVSPMGCAMDSILRLLMGQWTCYILWTLCRKGPLRFGELKRVVQGISSKVLTERLRLLEDAGVIYREHVPTIPPQVTYGLSDRGRELVGVLRSMADIAERWCLEDKEQDQEAKPLQSESKSSKTLLPFAQEKCV